MKRTYPTITQANLMFLLISIAILFASTMLAPRIGYGTNLWINEYIWILTPVLLLMKLDRLPVNEVFKLRKTSKKNLLLSILIAVGMWFFAFYISKLTGIFLDTQVGPLQINLTDTSTSVRQSVLLLIGMVILAPICEELLFRGVILSAYEVHHKKYGYLMAAILFGMLHTLNGVTEIIPTFLTGIMLGYLVYRTGSIATSITAHMAFNVSAILIGGGMGLTQLISIPMWLHITSIGTFMISLLLLRLIKPRDENGEQLNSNIHKGYPISSILFLVLSILFFIIIGSIEFYMRLKT